MNKLKLSIIFIILLIVTVNAEENRIFSKNIKYTNILKNILPANLKGLKIIDESDFRLDEFKKIHGSNGEKVYNYYLKTEKRFNSVVERDFNRNGKLDVAIACSTPSRDSSYLVILEENGKSYQFIQSIKFEQVIIFLILNSKPANSDLYINFLEGDYGKYFLWNGKEYIAKKEDPYGA
jgi:hypothetical protein